MAKYYYVAEAVYDGGRSVSCAEHKNEKHCFEDLRRLMNKVDTNGLQSIGIVRKERENVLRDK